MKITLQQLNKFEEGWELWINSSIYHFNTINEAYSYYLDNFATKEDFAYYKECCGRDLRDNLNNEELIGMMFKNVFNEKHHLYQVIKRKDGQVIRS